MPTSDGRLSMPSGGKKKNLGLYFLVGCIILVLLIGGAVIIYKSTRNDKMDSSDEWTKLGPVDFANEYGINTKKNEDYILYDYIYDLAGTFYADEIYAVIDERHNPNESPSQEWINNIDIAKAQEEYAIKIRKSFQSTKKLNEKNPTLYRKSNGVTNMYEIRINGGGDLLPIERGSFVTIAGDVYNARVLYSSDGQSQNDYHYFSIFE